MRTITKATIAVIDIGGTRIKSGIWKDGRLSKRRECDTEAMAGGAHVIRSVKEILAEYQEDEFRAVGISTAGQVNRKDGSILYANENIPGYTGMKVKEILEQEFHVPVAVENDVNCAAIGEACFGAGAGYEDFLCLTYGTGIGGAVFLNGEIYHGAVGSAGEFGSMILHPKKKERAQSAFDDRYEKHASVAALVRQVQSRFPELDNGRKIMTSMDNGNVKVRELVEQWMEEVSYGLVTLIHIFNPPLIILGGGIMEQPYIAERISHRVRREIMPSFRTVKIVPAALGNDAGMLGAAICAAIHF